MMLSRSKCTIHWTRILVPLTCTIIFLVISSFYKSRKIAQVPEIIATYLMKTSNRDEAKYYLKQNEIDVKRVQKICWNHNIHFNYPARNSKRSYCTVHRCPIFVGKNPNFLYCGMAKVAISSMKLTLIQHFGLNIKPGPDFHVKLNKKLERISPKLAEKPAYRDYSKFIIVRHPFERLLSAYIDKMNVNGSRDKYFNSIKREHFYVENVTKDTAWTFSDFVDYVIKIPNTKANVHWRAYWIYCGVCETTYDYIVRMETIERDLKVLFNILGLSHKDDINWTNRSNSTNLTIECFAELTKSQVKRLYEKFMNDFLLFDYSIEPFLSYAKSD